MKEKVTEIISNARKRIKSIAGLPGEDSLRMRYVKLYGEREGQIKTETERKRTRLMYRVTAAAFAAALVLAAFSMAGSDSGITTDESGGMTSVQRPSEAEGSRLIDVYVIAEKDGHTISEKEQIWIDPKGKNDDKGESAGEMLGEESKEDALRRAVDSKVREINSGREGAAVVLPSELGDGTKLRWEQRTENNIPLILIAFAACLIMIFKTSDAKLRKEESEAKRSIVRELPGFINKFTLLINAGLVTNEAFGRIMSDYELMRPAGKKYFYEQLLDTERRAEETKSPFHEELSAFAKRSEVRELMRFSNIVNDNISKGFDLVEKLKRESEVMWFERKKQSEEKGRIAETKLTLPLMILLLVLITVTTAPALMDI